MKLKNNLEARNLVQSNVDPCVFFGEGSVVLTHVGDEIIIGDTTKKIDKLIQALHGGNNKFDSTDKGSIDKYLGVEIKQLGKDSFELSQPFLIKRGLAPLGIEYGTTNKKPTPVGQPLLKILVDH